MIDRQQLLKDLQTLLKRIEADLLERSESTEVPEVLAALHAEYEKAAKAERTAQNYEDWRTDTITQAAAAWVLSCVFVRFLEDNSLIDPPKMSGPLSLVTGHSRLQRARDEHELYFRKSPQHSDREYLLSIFDELKKLPGTRELFTEFGKQLSVTNDKGQMTNDQIHWISGDAAGELLKFFQTVDANSGVLVHDFTDPNWDTRFLGDLYQDLSEAARKKFALLQTPDFVEEFILDRTLEPALEEFGLVPNDSSSPRPASGRGAGGEGHSDFKMIDPACGSGHFLLGTFPRLLDRWQRKEPGTNVRELAQRALNSIHGVDINPFAVAIAKFRLLLVAMKACDIRRLADAPAFQINVACGDSLLHGENRTSTGQRLMDFAEGATDEELYSHAYPGEDLQTVRALLKPGTYHCVVANPPYIVPKDRKLNDWYRKRFSACHMKYSLAVPFLQQIFQLSVQGGFTGQITANSFMKREFGKKLIESFFPTVDLSHVLDTSGAYIPGHGTPTTILFGRNREYVGSSLRTVLGIRGEPSAPENPGKGLVWSSIVDLVDRPGQQNGYVSSGDSERSLFHKHPWSIGGGGASELKDLLETSTSKILSQCGSTGIGVVTLEDEAFTSSAPVLMRKGIPGAQTIGFVEGDRVRDWLISNIAIAIFPYDRESQVPQIGEAAERVLWPLRKCLENRIWFSKTQIERGLKWFEYGMLSSTVLATDISIVWSFVATHNHFVFDLGGKVFKQSSPVLKFPLGTSTSDILGLLGVLNCSVVCFYLKQIGHNKGDSTDQHGARTTGDPAFNTYEYGAAMVNSIPLPKAGTPSTTALDRLAQQLSSLFARDVLFMSPRGSLREHVSSIHQRWMSISKQLIAGQENLDWECYQLYDLIDRDLTEPTSVTSEISWYPISLGQRAFEIVLARRLAAGHVQSTWFERHGSTPITELPAEWPEDYKKLVERRIELIENDPNIRLIEQPEYKRRWNTESWESQLERALREWLLLRLETYFDFDGRMSLVTSHSSLANDKGPMTSDTSKLSAFAPLREISVYSVAQLADAARRDPQFMEVGELYRNDPAFDVQSLVEELVAAESVPHLPILRYKDSGLRKRAEWEKTWELQREEDRLTQRRKDAKEETEADLSDLTPLREIPVPPKYTSADFISTGGARYWSLRGKLDVPKERWISFPHCEGPDGTLVICWAGYDHLQQAQAISAYYVRVQTEFGGSDDPRLIPLLASLIELLPWLMQWHNEPNANFDGLRMGDYFEGFVNEEARNLGKTLAEIKAWAPVKKVAKTKSSKSKKKSAQVEVEAEE